MEGVKIFNRTAEQRGMTARQKARIFATLKSGKIQDGKIIAPDGTNMSHRMRIVDVVPEPRRRYVENRSTMGLFSKQNGGFVSFMFSSCVTMVERFPSLTQADYARLMFLGTYTSYDNSRLRYDNGKIINREGLRRLTGMSRSRFSEFYRRLVAEDILRRQHDGSYKFNPKVFQRGGEDGLVTDAQHIRLYRDTIRKLYDEYGRGRDARQLAVVFAVIPFLHYQLNIVCYNPQEYYDDEIRPMTLEKLAALLGYAETQKLKAAMNRVRLNGQPVFGFVEDVHDRRKRRIIVNPRVVYSGNAEGLEKVRALCVLFN